MIVIRIERKQAAVLLLGVAGLLMIGYQGYQLATAAYEIATGCYQLVKNIHFTIVQAPLESALNQKQGE